MNEMVKTAQSAVWDLFIKKFSVVIYIMFSNESSMEQCDSFMFYTSNLNWI